MNIVKKKLLPVLCMVILVNFVIPLNAATNEGNCDHDKYGEYVNQIIDNGCSVKNITATTHIRVYTDFVYCRGCDNLKAVRQREVVEPHKFVDTNLGHIGTSGHHRYRSDCSECGYEGEIHIVPCIYEECAG